LPEDKTQDKNSHDILSRNYYREYTLDELKYLLHKESFIIIDAHFFSEKNLSRDHHFVLNSIYRTLQIFFYSLKNYNFIMARGNFSDDLPEINKVDPFKLRSMHVFNSKWLSNYDTPTLYNRFFTHNWDRYVLEQLPNDISNLRILDIGCGWGRLLTALADKGALLLAGMDIAPRMVDLVRQRLIEHGVVPEIKVGDAEDKIPWEDETFDVITMTGSLHHFYRPNEVLKEVYRVIRKNGYIIIIDPWFFPPIRKILNYLCSFKAADGDYRFYSPKEISNLLFSNGFTLYRQDSRFNSLLVTGRKS
jgi:ubiquinone/menaquinone biosynthesis C-methylase UbiE